MFLTIFLRQLKLFKLLTTASLQIFTEDIPEVESLPRDQVLSHIEQNAKQLVIPYLVRYSITGWAEIMFVFFEQLIQF